MVALAVLPGVNLFSSPPKGRPESRFSTGKLPPPPIPVPKYAPKKYPSGKPVNPALKTVHRGTKYYRPIPDDDGAVTADGSGRSVMVGESGISYLLPDAPFEFQFSYSEVPKAKPLAMREPAYLPFAPPTMARPWTGKPPLKKKEEKKKRRKVALFEPLNSPEDAAGGTKLLQKQLPFRREVKTREEILGKPLSRAEIRALIKPLVSCNRQVNLGRDGLTHNMLELIHTHWRRQQVCKVRCLGVPTVDMDNICYHVEEKTGGKVIYRVGGVIYLFRGRNYNHQTRTQFPVMLWKPAAPIYPKLIQEAPAGLTKSEADDLRRKGKNLLPICKLAKNGVYINLVKDVREAFEQSSLVKINCQGMHATDYKKLGAKLMELVPCVLLSFDGEQILMWRGKDWRSMYPEAPPLLVDPLVDNLAEDNLKFGDMETVPPGNTSGETDEGWEDSRVDKPVGEMNGKMFLLWKHALDLQKALLLDEIDLDPDELLDKTEKFSGHSQAREHSYPALILPEGTDAAGGANDLMSRDL
ncbi:unnamed protein product [Victoria cruziana]